MELRFKIVTQLYGIALIILHMIAEIPAHFTFRVLCSSYPLTSAPTNCTGHSSVFNFCAQDWCRGRRL